MAILLIHFYCAILKQDDSQMDQQHAIDYKLLVDNLTTAILLVDSKLNIFYLNSACEALFDISLLRASGQPALNLLHAHDDAFNSHEALLNTLKTGQHYTRREAVIYVNFKMLHDTQWS